MNTLTKNYISTNNNELERIIFDTHPNIKNTDTVPRVEKIRALYECPTRYISMRDIALYLGEAVKDVGSTICHENMTRSALAVLEAGRTGMIENFIMHGHGIEKHTKLLTDGAECLDDEGNNDNSNRVKYLKMIHDTMLGGSEGAVNVAVQVNTGAKEMDETELNRQRAQLLARQRIDSDTSEQEAQIESIPDAD